MNVSRLLVHMICKRKNPTSTRSYVGSATSTYCFLRKMWCQEKTFKLQFQSVKTPFIRIVNVIWSLGPAGSSSKFCHCLSKTKLGKAMHTMLSLCLGVDLADLCKGLNLPKTSLPIFNKSMMLIQCCGISRLVMNSHLKYHYVFTFSRLNGRRLVCMYKNRQRHKAMLI